MDDRMKFLLRNLIKGFVWLGILLFVFLMLKKNIDVSTYEKYQVYLSNPVMVYGVYTLSELLFGILPPELFMIWGLDQGGLNNYIFVVTLLALISYGAGWVGYFFGRFLGNTVLFRLVKMRFLRKYERLLNTYGSYLIIAASITPIPYSAVCMMVGAVKYPRLKFFLYTLARFVRFALYSFIIWETITLT